MESVHGVRTGVTANDLCVCKRVRHGRMVFTYAENLDHTVDENTTRKIPTNREEAIRKTHSQE